MVGCSHDSLASKAFEKASALPDDEQDAIAALLLGEMDEEREWDSRFAATQEQLGSLADRALQQHRRGETDEFLAASGTR